MSQQCGNCKFFDCGAIKYGNGICHHIDTPELIVMHKDDGENCPVYEERKECEE